jgi:hypothetical protein
VVNSASNETPELVDCGLGSRESRYSDYGPASSVVAAGDDRIG